VTILNEAALDDAAEWGDDLEAEAEALYERLAGPNEMFQPQDASVLNNLVALQENIARFRDAVQKVRREPP
jgi:hypothetical protein